MTVRVFFVGLNRPRSYGVNKSLEIAYLRGHLDWL